MDIYAQDAPSKVKKYEQFLISTIQHDLYVNGVEGVWGTNSVKGGDQVVTCFGDDWHTMHLALRSFRTEHEWAWGIEKHNSFVL